MTIAHETKTVTIIVNGRSRTTPKDDLSFSEIVALAFDNPPTGDNVEITITYTRGKGEKPAGSLTPGQTVKVKDGMIFNVTATNRS